MKKKNIRKWRLSARRVVFMVSAFLFLTGSRVKAAQDYGILPTEAEEEAEGTGGIEIEEEAGEEIGEETGGETSGETGRETGRRTGEETSGINGNTYIGNIIPGISLIKRIPLNDSTVTQIPRYITEDGIFYVLDENAVTIEETGHGSSEGADVVTTTRTVTNLPDNDLERIDKTISYEGITCKLLCIAYEIVGRDEQGIPNSYSAVCEYGGLKKYSISYATDWQAVVRYDAYERITLPIEQDMGQEEETGTVNGAGTGYGYGGGDFWQKNTQEFWDGAGEPEDAEDEKNSDQPEHRLMVRKTPLQDEKWDIWKFVLLLLGILLALGILCALIYGLYALLSNSALLFSLTRKGKYRYIGCLRLREKEGNCIVSLPERVIARAEILSFKMKIPEKAVKRIGMGMLMVQCPDGKAIVLILGKEVAFSFRKELMEEMRESI